MRGHKRPKIQTKRRKKQRLKQKPVSFLRRTKKVMVRVGLSDAVKKAGIEAGRYKVRHLIARLGLEVRYPKRYRVTTDRDHNAAIAPNKLDRQFAVAEPNKVWTTDITYV
jgi:putative transposase